MQRRALLLCIGLVACEKATPSSVPPTPIAKVTPSPVTPTVTPTPTPAPTQTPEPPVPEESPSQPALAPPPPPPPPPQTRGRLLAEDKLPQPSNPDDPTAYRAWQKGLSKQDRANVDTFCAARPNRWNYHAVCGGIGPKHIPRPPSLVAQGVTRGDHDAWRKSLSNEQRYFYVYWCEKNIDEGEIGYSELCGGTPLVVAFDADAPVVFAHGRVGVSTATPWLAIDLDHSGTIDATELFGDATILPDGSRARNGFAALAALDANRDGVVDAADPAFASLVLWRDLDGDNRGSAGELAPLASAGIASLELANTRVPRCTAEGCEGERSTMTFRDPATNELRRGAVIDVYFKRSAL